MVGPITPITKLNQGDIVTDFIVCFSACTNDLVLNIQGIKVSPLVADRQWRVVGNAEAVS